MIGLGSIRSWALQMLLVVAGAVLGAGCDRDDELITPLVRPGVTVISDEIAALTTVLPDRLSLPGDRAEFVLRLPKGQILVAGYEDGFLRRLIKASREGDRIVALTEGAVLTGAIEQGALKTSLDLPAGASIPSALTAGAEFDVTLQAPKIMARALPATQSGRGKGQGVRGKGPEAGPIVERAREPREHALDFAMALEQVTRLFGMEVGEALGQQDLGFELAARTGGDTQETEVVGGGGSLVALGDVVGDGSGRLSQLRDHPEAFLRREGARGAIARAAQLSFGAQTLETLEVALAAHAVCVSVARRAASLLAVPLAIAEGPSHRAGVRFGHSATREAFLVVQHVRANRLLAVHAAAFAGARTVLVAADAVHALLRGAVVGLGAGDAYARDAGPDPVAQSSGARGGCGLGLVGLDAGGAARRAALLARDLPRDHQALDPPCARVNVQAAAPVASLGMPFVASASGCARSKSTSKSETSAAAG